MGDDLKDLTGMQFGRLTVVSRAQNKEYPSGRIALMWNCACDCGRTVVVAGGSLKSGATRSCGCLRRQLATKHGQSTTRLYQTYTDIKQRCENPNNDFFADYGGRGIHMCTEWRNNFDVFSHWAFSSGYSDELTIERIDVNGNYDPKNCKWISKSEQQMNKRNNRFLEFHSERHPVAEWAKIIGISKNTLYSRLRRGWSVKDTLSKQLQQGRKP